MPPVQGELTLLSIGVIFVLVFGGIYQVSGYTAQPTLPRDSASGVERTAREAVWGAVNGWRASQDLFTASRTDGVEIEAQETAEAVAANRSLDGPVASGRGISGDPHLPNPAPRCTQIAVPVALPPGAVEDGTLTQAGTETISRRALRKLRSVDSLGILERGVWANAGIGVSIADDSVTVVYRSCSAGRFSP